jgi:hypothetical protein
MCATSQVGRAGPCARYLGAVSPGRAGEVGAVSAPQRLFDRLQAQSTLI